MSALALHERAAAGWPRWSLARARPSPVVTAAWTATARSIGGGSGWERGGFLFLPVSPSLFSSPTSFSSSLSLRRLRCCRLIPRARSLVATSSDCGCGGTHEK